MQLVLAAYVHRMRYQAPSRYCIEQRFHTNPSRPYVQYQVLGDRECSATVSIVTVLYVLQAIPDQGNARRDPNLSVLNRTV